MIEIQMDVYDFFMLEILYHKVFSSAWMNIIFQFWHCRRKCRRFSIAYSVKFCAESD